MHCEISQTNSGAADVGESMLQRTDGNDKFLDCQAVCHIAKTLLELDSGPKPKGILRLEAEEFANTPFGVSVDELLRVCPSYNLGSHSANDLEAPVPSQGN